MDCCCVSECVPKIIEIEDEFIKVLVGCNEITYHSTSRMIAVALLCLLIGFVIGMIVIHELGG
jgi:hypothetical protein